MLRCSGTTQTSPFLGPWGQRLRHRPIRRWRVTATLIAIWSTILHFLQTLATPPDKYKLPHVRGVLVAFLIVASIVYTAFVVLLRPWHDELFDTLSKLLCVFHDVFAEVLPPSMQNNLRTKQH